MTTTQDLFDLTEGDNMSREVMTLPRGMSLPVADQALAQAQVSRAPMVDSDERCIGVFSTSDRARRTQLGKRAAQRAPCVPGCVCSDWQVVEDNWDPLPAASAGPDMTMVPVPIPAETWIG